MKDAGKQLQEGGFAYLPISKLSPLTAQLISMRDLFGLRVINQQDIELGVVKNLMETGVNDVLVVFSEKENKERLIPWTMHNAIVAVDLAKGVIRVEWDADF
mgnify:CR=1 FL=1